MWLGLRQSGGISCCMLKHQGAFTHTQMTKRMSSCAALLHRQRTHLYGAGSEAFQILSQRMEERSQQGKNVCAGCSVNIPARSTSYKHDLFWKKLLNHITKPDLMHLLPGIHNICKIQCRELETLCLVRPQFSTSTAAVFGVCVELSLSCTWTPPWVTRVKVKG